MKQLIYGAAFAIFCTGAVFAVDERIDQRVQVAIDANVEQTIENKLEFYVMKKEMMGLSGEDKINEKILEMQLNKLRNK